MAPPSPLIGSNGTGFPAQGKTVAAGNSQTQQQPAFAAASSAVQPPFHDPTVGAGSKRFATSTVGAQGSLTGGASAADTAKPAAVVTEQGFSPFKSMVWGGSKT